MSVRSPMALSHLKFRHLMLVQRLIEGGTVHKAARHLSVSQPAATAMLNDLERLVGLSLFTRSRQGIVPTEQALAIFDRVRTILNEFGELVSSIERVAAGGTSLLHIGVRLQCSSRWGGCGSWTFRWISCPCRFA